MKQELKKNEHQQLKDLALSKPSTKKIYDALKEEFRLLEERLKNKENE